MDSQDVFGIRGKTAVVTGGAAGIGFGIVKRFVEAGADVVLADLNEKMAHSAAKSLKGPGRVHPMPVDLSHDEAGESLVDTAFALFKRFDILVNNAGIYPQIPAVKMSVEILDRVLGVNLRGLILACKAAAAAMIRQNQGGRIINISSVDSVHPSMVGLAAYDASKGGVLMFTKSLALELAPHNILVNAIAPGGISTEGTAKPLEGSGMTPAQMKEMMAGFVKNKIPLGRMGVPDDIAKVAQFLASPAADYITGSTVFVDGGMLLS